jgi:phospholipid-binding lipoprotein MlaA
VSNSKNNAQRARCPTVAAVLLAVTLASCSSVPTARQEPVTPALDDTTAADQSAAEQLSSGHSTAITTSQGTLELEPTVVDMAPPAGSDSNAAELSGDPYPDPLQGWNRSVFRFNHFTYTYGLFPLVQGYESIVPAVIRSKIGNALRNIREPLQLVNNLAAGDIKDAGTNLGRFLLNSTLGLFGLFDPATAWFELPAAPQSLANTLASYKVGSGPYLVLPLFGQNNVRGTVSLGSGILLDPLRHVTSAPDTYYLQGLDVVNSFTDRTRIYQQIYQQADDPYLYFRNQFIQGVKRDDAFGQQE